MKVNNTGVKPTDVTLARELDTKKSDNKKNPAGIFDKSSGLGGASKVEVSEKAQSLQKAKEIASKQTVDEAKVARLQKLIDEGKYKVDASAVADRMIDEHLSTGE